MEIDDCLCLSFVAFLILCYIRVKLFRWFCLITLKASARSPLFLIHFASFIDVMLCINNLIRV
jgi:hypothetical protein